MFPGEPGKFLSDMMKKSTLKRIQKFVAVIKGTERASYNFVRLSPYQQELFTYQNGSIFVGPRYGKLISVVREPLTDGPNDAGEFEVTWTEIPGSWGPMIEHVSGDKICWYT
jgi:hypothetical protein